MVSGMATALCVFARVATKSRANGHWQQWVDAFLKTYGWNGHLRRLNCRCWSSSEKAETPNRQVYVLSSQNGPRPWIADGTPVFMLGDTWLLAPPGACPFRNAPHSIITNRVPALVFGRCRGLFRKAQGFNSVSMKLPLFQLGMLI